MGYVNAPDRPEQATIPRGRKIREASWDDGSRTWWRADSLKIKSADGPDLLALFLFEGTNEESYLMQKNGARS